MTYTRRNRGVCSSLTTVTLSDGGVIEDIEVRGGCDGNLKGVCALLKGMRAEEAISRCKGIRCGMRTTSCPDQISLALEEALAQKAE